MSQLYKLYNLRKIKGITQAEMAQKLGLSTTSYGDKERGKTEFKLSEIKKILKILDVDFEMVFGESVFPYEII
ncbi:MAG: helix-turn-helix transcriptional regulator [archaeon]